MRLHAITAAAELVSTQKNVELETKIAFVAGGQTR